MYFTAGGQTYNLGSSVGSTDTSILLSSFTEPVSETPYTMALLNSEIVYGTIAPGTSSSEFISFTGITQNANGTALLTGVTRGLQKKYPYTTSVTFKLPHSGQSIFILSDAPQVFNEYAALKNENVFDEVNTFTLLPESNGGNATNPTQLITYAQALSMATGTANINRVIVAGTAGETVAVDQVVYLKSSDGRWWLADADIAATSENVILGIAQGSGTAGNPITSGVLIFGLNTFSSLTLTANTKYYISNTAGGFSSSPGTNEITLGESQTTTTFIFCPRNDQQITEDQQDALAGDSGTPSATNLYVTQKGLQINTEKYAADTSGSSTAYVVDLSPVPAAYVTGMVIYAKIVSANTTTTPTLNLNSLGAKTIVKGTNTALAVGDIGANSFNTFIYDGTNLVLQNPNANLLTSLVPSYSLVSTVTMSAVAVANGTITKVAEFTGLTGDAQDVYLVDWEGAVSNSVGAAAYLALRINDDSAGNYGYNFTRLSSSSVTAPTPAVDVAATEIRIMSAISSGGINITITNTSATIHIKASKTIAGTSRMVISDAVGSGNTSTIGQQRGVGLWGDTTNQITSLQMYFFQNDGSYTMSGKVSLYKINRS